jgi:hypothetical protein
MQVFLGLFLDGSDHFRMTMPHVAYTDASDQIDVSLPFLSSQQTPSSLLHLESQGRRRGLGQMPEEKLAGLIHEWQLKYSANYGKSGKEGLTAQIKEGLFSCRRVLPSQGKKSSWLLFFM